MEEKRKEVRGEKRVMEQEIKGKRRKERTTYGNRKIMNKNKHEKL